MGCCCSNQQSGGAYHTVSYYGDGDDVAEEMIDIEAVRNQRSQVVDEKNSTVDTVMTMATASSNIGIGTDAAEEEEEEPDGEDDADGYDEDSIDDPLYYTQYRAVPDPVTRGASTGGLLDQESQERARYEMALAAFDGTVTETKRQLIREYEARKSTYYNLEHVMLAEELLRKARCCQVAARKKELYREAIWHTTDAERKSAVKDEYNQFYRSLDHVQ